MFLCDTIDVFAHVHRQTRHVQAVDTGKIPDDIDVEVVVEHALHHVV